MKHIPVHIQDIESKNYSGVARGVRKSITGLSSHSESLEILAKMFGYADHKQVISLASSLPRIDKSPQEYTEILKQNIDELGLLDIDPVNIDGLKYLVSFGYFIDPIEALNKRTVDIIGNFYLDCIQDDVSTSDEMYSRILGYKMLIAEGLSSIPEAGHEQLLEKSLHDLFNGGDILERGSRLIFLEIHGSKCLQAIKDATHIGLQIGGPGMVFKERHDENRVFLSMTTETIVKKVSDLLYEKFFRDGRVKGINFFVNELDQTPILLSDFHLDDFPTRSQVKKEYSEARKYAKAQHQPVPFDDYLKYFDADDFNKDRQGDLAVVSSCYQHYLEDNKKEIDYALEEVREEYSIPLKLESIEKKKKVGSNKLFFKLSEEFGEGNTGSVVPYLWHCSIRSNEGAILAIASGHIYSASGKYYPSISDIFTFEDNYTIDYGLYANAFYQKLEETHGIEDFYNDQPEIAEYLDDSVIVFLKNFYRDQSGKSFPGYGISVLDYAVTCIEHYFECPMLLVCFVDPPQYTANDKCLPDSIKKRQKKDVDKICGHIYDGLSSEHRDVCEIMFIEPKYKAV